MLLPDVDSFTASEKDAKYVLERIKSENTLEITKSRILRLCQKFSKDEIAEPLELLEDMGYIKYIPPVVKTRGRPSENYRVNPLVFE